MATKPVFNAAAQPSFDAKVVRAFLEAARDSAWEIVQGMIDRHGPAIVRVKDEQGAGAIAYAARSAKTRNIEILLKNGANINAADGNGMTPLMTAALRGLKSLAEFLLSNGAKMEQKDNEGMTALMHAAYHSTRVTKISKPSPQMSQRKLDTIRMLIQRGASLTAEDGHGRTTERQAELRRNYDALAVISDEKEKRAGIEAEYQRKMEAAISRMRTGSPTAISAPESATFRKRQQPLAP